MFAIVKYAGNGRNTCQKCHIELTGVFQLTQVAAYKNLVLPKKKVIDLPENPKARRLAMLDKTPQFVGQVGAFKIKRLPKDLGLIRGPELVHNKLQYGHIGIQTLNGGYFNFKHLNNMRVTLNRAIDDQKMFATWRIEHPWRPVTQKPANTRMGGGKGGIKDFAYPVKSKRIVLEVGGDVELPEIRRILKHISGQMPMRSRVVTKEMLEEEEAYEEKLERLNVNPFSFKKCAWDNYLGIKKEMSPFDILWNGKYR